MRGSLSDIPTGLSIASEGVGSDRYPVLGDHSAGDNTVALTLDSQGVIHDCDAGSEALFKYCRSAIVGQHIATLLPQLKLFTLVLDGHTNEHLRYLSRIGYHFLALTQDGDEFPSKLFINVLDASGNGRLSLLVRPAEKPGYDMTLPNANIEL